MGWVGLGVGEVGKVVRSGGARGGLRGGLGALGWAKGSGSGQGEASRAWLGVARHGGVWQGVAGRVARCGGGRGAGLCGEARLG